MWPLYALTASLLWGVSYAVIGNLLKTVHAPSIVLIELLFGAVAFAGLACFDNTLKADLSTLLSNGSMCKQLVVAAVVFNVANFLIVYSVREADAVVVSLLEITYPLFVVLFSWLLFRETHMNLRTALGGVLIMSGVALIYWKNK